MAARDAGIDLLAIGVGPRPRERELRAISSDPVGNNVFMVADFNTLETIREAIIDSLCDSQCLVLHFVFSQWVEMKEIAVTRQNVRVQTRTHRPFEFAVQHTLLQT